jgi:RNA polymerase sigma-70 factor (ECF subfamily)
MYIPIGMYAILIGTFVTRVVINLVLVCQTKILKMETGIKHPGKTYVDPHSHLIEGCRKRDHSSQFMIYKLYYKAMYNTALRIVKDTMEAEDIMQESFLAAFEKIETFSGNVTFGAWLRKIVLNRSLDSLKKSQKMVVSDLEVLRDTKEPLEENEQNSDIVTERYGRLKKVIGELPEKYKNIITLHFLDGYDYSEISQILTTSSSTVRSQISRARKMIRSEMH